MKDKIHITLVYICPFKTWNLYPPLGIAFLASSLRVKGYGVSIVDTTFDTVVSICETIKRCQSSIVGFEVLQANYSQSLVIAGSIRESFPGIPIVFGGPYPTVLPEEILKQNEVDLVFRGEGETAILEIMEHIEGCRPLSEIDGLCYKRNGEAVINPPRVPVRDLDSIVPAAYDMLRMGSYLNIPLDMPMASPGATLFVTRGCYGGCIYCQPSSKMLFGQGVRRCSPARVVEEMRGLYNRYKVRSIIFCDDEPLWNGKAWWLEVGDLLLKSRLKLDLMVNSRVDTVDEELFLFLKKAGLKYLAFGVESGSDKILKELKKGYSADKIVRAFQLCRKLGIVSRANIMIGSPSETWGTFNETLNMLSIARPDVISVSVTSPIPGTFLYENMKDSLSPESIRSEAFDRKHIVSIARDFSESDIRIAIRKTVNLFMKMTLSDAVLRTSKKWALIKMLALREISLARIGLFLPFQDIAFHLGYIKRTFHEKVPKGK